jgi:hypothetical protein
VRIHLNQYFHALNSIQFKSNDKVKQIDFIIDPLSHINLPELAHDLEKSTLSRKSLGAAPSTNMVAGRIVEQIESFWMT